MMEAESNLDAAMEAQNDALEDRLFSQFFPSGMLGGQAEGSTAPPSESLDNDGSLRGQPAAKFADSQTDRKVTMPKRRMRMIRGPHGADPSVAGKHGDRATTVQTKRARWPASEKS